MTDGYAPGKPHIRHVERHIGGECGQGHAFDRGPRWRHVMDDAFGIDARENDAALDAHADAPGAAAFALLPGPAIVPGAGGRYFLRLRHMRSGAGPDGMS